MKPTITPQEASWREHLAGMQAAEAARQAGANPATVAAMATATAGPAAIAGLALAPASQGTLWTLQRIAREFTAHADAAGHAPAADPAAPGTRELIELGLATLVFIDARETWRTLDAGGLPNLIAQAEDLIWTLPLADQMALQNHFRREMDRIRDLAGGEEEPAPAPGKQTPPAGPSPAMPTPPQAPASPPANGSPPSIAYPSPLPSGTHHW